MKRPDDKNDERVQWEHEDLASVKVKAFHGHKNKVSSVHFCSKCSKIISSSYDQTCKIWDIMTGKVVNTFSNHCSEINYCELNKTETQMVTCGWDAQCCIIDLATGKDVLSVQCGGTVMCAKFSLSDNLVITASDLDNLISIIDLRSGQRVKCIKGLHNSTPTTCAFITDDQRIVSTSMDRTVKIFDIRSDIVTISLKDHTNIVSDAAVSGDEHLLASTSYDKSVLVYNLNTGVYRKNGPMRLSDGHDGCVSSCRFSTDARLLVSGGYDGNLVIWNMNNQTREIRLQGHDDWIEDVDISDDNCWILSCSKDRTIRLWNMENSEKLPSIVAAKPTAKQHTIECAKCGNVYSSMNSNVCVFCRIGTETNDSMDSVKQKLHSMMPQ